MRTKIVTTVGPATHARDAIHALLDLGADVLRINMAHGRHDEHADVIKWAREACSTGDKPLAVLADLADIGIHRGMKRSPRCATAFTSGSLARVTRTASK